MVNKYQDKLWLKQKYIEEDLEQQEIADICGVNQTTISRYIVNNGLQKNERVECPECNDTFSSIGRHWENKESHIPSLSDEQEQMFIGILMSDGSIHSPKNQNSRMLIKMTNKEYLQWLDDKLGILSTGVSKAKTAKEKAKKDRESGWNKKAKTENYSDMYFVGTRRCSIFNKYRRWYSSGQKRWPMNDITLTPTTLKHFFVGDGTKAGSDIIKIGCKNEADREEKVRELFQEVGFEISYFGSHSFGFDQETSYRIFEYMGEPLPGFEYKWP